MLLLNVVVVLLNHTELVQVSGAAMFTVEVPLKLTVPLALVNPLLKVTVLKVSSGEYIETSADPLNPTGPVNVELPFKVAVLLVMKGPLKVAVPVESKGADTDTGDDPLKNTLLPALVKPLLKRTGALLVTLPNIWIGAQNENVTGALNVVVLFKNEDPFTFNEAPDSTVIGA